MDSSQPGGRGARERAMRTGFQSGKDGVELALDSQKLKSQHVTDRFRDVGGSWAARSGNSTAAGSIRTCKADSPRVIGQGPEQGVFRVAQERCRIYARRSASATGWQS